MKKNFAFLFIVVGLLCIVVIVIFGTIRISYPVKYKAMVVERSSNYNLSQSLVFAVIKAESNFDTKAVSYAGARGLMQIMPSTGLWISTVLNIENYNDNQLFDPNINIHFGCFYLNYLIDRFSTVEQVLAAYNLGETTVRQLSSDTDKFMDELKVYSQTYKYVNEVLKYQKIYEKII